MKKLKAKQNASQKRKAKKKVKRKMEELERGNWVLDRLDWIEKSINNNNNSNNDDADAAITNSANNDYDDNTTNDCDDNADQAEDDDDDDEEEHEQQRQTRPSYKKQSKKTTTTTTNHDISLVCWNVLADSYCSRSSHKNLPMTYQTQVFNRKQRQHSVRQTIKLLDAKLLPSLIALQEVDPPLELSSSKCLTQLGYGCIETTSCPDGKVGRVDACGLYYRQTEWTCLEYETVQLDELAILRSSASSTIEASSAEIIASVSVPGNDVHDIKSEKEEKRTPSTTCSSSDSSYPKRRRSNSNINKKSKKKNNNASLAGLQRSFVRKNVALLVRLGHIPTGRRLVVIVAHLFWNPSYEYVKLCQAHYIAIRAAAFCRQNNNNNNNNNNNSSNSDNIKMDEKVPIIWCGDFNSKPDSSVYRYITTGIVNAKAVAPWYKIAQRQEQQENDKTIKTGALNATKCSISLDGNNNSNSYSKNLRADADECNDSIKTLKLDRLDLNDDSDEEELLPPGNDNKHAAKFAPDLNVRYMLDYTLNKLCRWLRILGIDAALETEEEEKERTKDAKITLFRRCKEERRSLVTTASKLLYRRDCPAGTYLLDTVSLKNLELSLVHMLTSHGVNLEPKEMLTRCVVCNGNIKPVYGARQRQTIFQSYHTPEDVWKNNEIMDVYQCDSCGQGYWWCEKPTSSASRVKMQATRLLELCIAGGVSVNDKNMGMFDHIDVDAIKQMNLVDKNNNINNDNNNNNTIRMTGVGVDDDGATMKSLLQNKEELLDVVQWLKTDRLCNPLRQMASAYALKDSTDGQNKESINFTNVTYDFVGHLDHILYSAEDMEVTDLLYVPNSFEELNDLRIPNGHLLPSCDWPSDHLSIGCRLSFIPETFEDTNDDPKVATPFPPLPPFLLSSPWCVVSNDIEIKSESVDEEVLQPTSPLQSIVVSSKVLSTVEPTAARQTSVVSNGPPPAVTQEKPDEQYTKAPKEPLKNPLTATSAEFPHGKRCGCGCIPPIPSLFEMAELRRQYRLKLKQNNTAQ